jgi:hypothetical protein
MSENRLARELLFFIAWRDAELTLRATQPQLPSVERSDT